MVLELESQSGFSRWKATYVLSFTTLVDLATMCLLPFKNKHTCEGQFISNTDQLTKCSTVRNYVVVVKRVWSFFLDLHI